MSHTLGVWTSKTIHDTVDFLTSILSKIFFQKKFFAFADGFQRSRLFLSYPYDAPQSTKTCLKNALKLETFLPFSQNFSMSRSRLINRIFSEKPKEVQPTESIELKAIIENPQIEEAEEIVTVEETQVDLGSEIPDVQDRLNEKFHIGEFEVLNQNLAYVLHNQHTLHRQLLDIGTKTKNTGINYLICLNCSILIVILVVCGLSTYGVYLLFNYLK